MLPPISMQGVHKEGAEANVLLLFVNPKIKTNSAHTKETCCPGPNTLEKPQGTLGNGPSNFFQHGTCRVKKAARHHGLKWQLV